MIIPEPRIIKNRGRIMKIYEFEHYLVRINRFPGDKEVFASIATRDVFYPEIWQGLGSNFFINSPSMSWSVKDKASALKMINEAFELAEYLENNLEELCPISEE